MIFSRFQLVEVYFCIWIIGGLLIIYVKDDLGFIIRSGYGDGEKAVDQRDISEGEKVECNDQLDLVQDDFQFFSWFFCIGRWKFSFVNVVFLVFVILKM